MATLFNTKISATYEGLLKTIDNAAISATLRELTDGSGNQSGLFLNTLGDFKVTSVLEWGSLKDTGTGVTITQFVTAANGIENFNNDTTLPTSAAVKLYVDTKFSQTDTLTEVLGFGNTTSGKDIAVSAGDDITFTDSSRILMGVSSDLQIYHDSANSYVRDIGTGRLWLDSNGVGVSIISDGSGATPMAHFYKDGAVELYYDNVKRFETTTDGSKVTGNLLVTGTITGAGGSFLPLAGGTMTGNIVLNDNVKSIYGTSSDGLEIFHDGTNSYVSNTGTGSLIIQDTNGTGDILIKPESGQIGIGIYNDNAVELSFAGTTKLSTTTTGVLAIGNLVATANVNVGANATFVDNGKAIFGASSDLQIYHDGANSFIQDVGAGNLNITSSGGSVQINKGLSENMATFIVDGAVNLYYDSSKKFETVTDGAKVTGNLEVTGTITGAGGSFLPLIGGTMTGNTLHNDNVKSIYGTASDGLEIYHDGTDSYIDDTGTGSLVIRSSDNIKLVTNTGDLYFQGIKDGAVKLYYDNSEKLLTTSTGISVSGNVVGTGDFRLSDNKQLQFGANPDLILFHNATDSFIRNNTGALNIEQAAVTESIVFKVSNANALDTTALTINREGDLITGKDVTIAGDLTVNGTTTTVNSQTLSVEDPLISLATANAANSLDIGFYGKYNDGTARYLGLFNDASDSNKFRLFKGTTVEPTTTVNIGGAGYVAADLVIAALETSSIVNVNNRVTIQDNGTLQWGANADYGNLTWDTGYALIYGLANRGIKFGTNGSTLALELDTSQNATFAGNVNLTGGRLSITSDGANAATLTESSAGIFTIAAVDDIILDAAGDIALDAGGNDIRFRVNGTTYGSFNNASSNLNIYSSIQDKDIKFLGNDGGTQITALTLDMSEGGNATFAGNVNIGAITGVAKPLLVKSPSDNTDVIVVEHSGNTVPMVALGQGNNHGYLDIRNNGGSSKVFLNSAGDYSYLLDSNFGIGTVSPTFKLHVNSTDASDNVAFIHHNSAAQSSGDVLKVRSDAGDNTGSALLNVQNNNGTALYVRGDRSVGIGTSNPFTTLHIESDNVGVNPYPFTGASLAIEGSGASGINILSDDAGDSRIYFGSTSFPIAGGIEYDNNATVADGSMFFRVANAEKFRIKGNGDFDFKDGNADFGGNVGIRSSGDNFLNISSINDGRNSGLKLRQSSAYGIDLFYIDSTSETRGLRFDVVNNGATQQALFIERDNKKVKAFADFEVVGASTFGGDVLISTTTAITTSATYGNITLDGSMTVGPNLGAISADASINVKEFGGKQISFFYGTTKVGGITSTSSATAYNTSSDYRLKEDLQDFKGLNMVSKIPVYDFKWKVDESRSYGVMAHELQEVLPDAVSGEKDAEEMQGVDYSKIVPVLIKAIQELKAEIDILKTK